MSLPIGVAAPRARRAVRHLRTCAASGRSRSPCAPATVWRAGRGPSAWHVAHAGGFGIPPGPCARWHVVQPFFSASCGPPVLSAWHDAQVAFGMWLPLCGSWQPRQAWCPFGALACSLVWQDRARRARLRLHGPRRRGTIAQSACPAFDDARVLSCAWQLAQRASLFVAGWKSCGLWQLVHGVLPACAPVSVGAIAAWQVVHGLTLSVHVSGVRRVARDARRLVAVSDLDLSVASRAGERRVRWDRGACGSSCRPRGPGRSSATSVSFAPWQPTQTLAVATKACGLWQPMQESWPAGVGPAGSLWHVLHSASATFAGAWGLWQSPHPADPAWAACSGARSVWQPSHAFGDDRRITVGAVALDAVGRRVRGRDRREAPRGLRMAADARGDLLLRREGVARQAVGHLRDAARVELGPFLGVASHAGGGTGVLEAVALVVVAALARHVRLCPRAACARGSSGTRPKTPAPSRPAPPRARACGARRIGTRRSRPRTPPRARGRRAPTASTSWRCPCRVAEPARHVVRLVLVAREARPVRASARDRRRCGSRRRAAPPHRHGIRRTTRDRSAPESRAHPPREPVLTHPTACGLRVVPCGETCDAVWHSMHELSLWHVAHSPGSARASSACRDRKPARCSPASGTSSNAIFAGRVGTVADAVALRARAFAMAARAEIALAAGPHAVLADPVAVVDEVARRGSVLGGEV